MIHLGKKLEEVAKLRGMGATELGKKLNTTRENIYSIYTRESIDIPLLLLCCKVLEYNFFQHIDEEEPLATYRAEEAKRWGDQLQSLNKTIEQLNELSSLQRELLDTQRLLIQERDKEIQELNKR